jgi:hypothetical protein
MKLLCLTFSLFTTVFLGRATGLAEDYSGYAALPEIERDRIVWDLHEHDEWGLPEQKPICRDLLGTQGHWRARCGACPDTADRPDRK